MIKSPYGSFRKGQLESVEFIRSNLGGFIALKAPTGFGKTLVAILSHLDAGKVFYVVRTRNELAPVIRELRSTGTSFTMVFSGRRMCPLVFGREVPSEDFWINCKLLRMKGLCNYFTNLSRYSRKYVLKLLMELDSIDPHEIARQLVIKLSICPFYALTSLADDVDFIIATYPYLFREDVYSTAFADLGLEDFYIIIDEAHNLLNPQTAISASIDLKTASLAYEVVNALGYHDVADYLRNLIKVINGVSSDRFKRIGKELIVCEVIEGRLSDILLELKLRILNDLMNRPENLMRTTSPLSRLVKFLYVLNKEYVNAYGILREDKEVHALPISYEAVMERLRIAKGVLMMSGSLPNKELVELIVRSDVKYLDVHKSYGPIFPEENVYYLVYTALTTSYLRRSERMFMDYAKLVKSIYEVNDGVTLAVYPSYEVLNEVATYLDDVNAVLNEDSRTKLSDVLNLVLRNSKLLINAVAGGKLVEGVEFRSKDGKSLVRAIIMCGVPYPQPDDYLADFKGGLAKYVGEDLARRIALDMQACIKTMQAIGRAVRSENDKAFIVLADRRYLSKSLRDILGINYNAITSKADEVVEKFKTFF